MVIKLYQPNRLITLYESSQTFRGELLFQQSQTLALPLESSMVWLGDLINFDFSGVTDRVEFGASLVENDLLSVWERVKDLNYFLGEKYYRYENVIRKYLAATLFLGSLIGFSIAAAPVVVSAVHYSISSNRLEEENKINENLLVNQTAPTLPENINDFRIEIPKIKLDSKVTPNVDPNSEKAYTEVLKDSVAHAKGSYLPGENGPIFLFAHSTDSIFDISQYDAKFFGVKDLKVGDEIDLYFEGKEYRYKMVGRKIIDPDNLDYIRSIKDNLILSTCYPPGTNWQRLIVTADQI